MNGRLTAQSGAHINTLTLARALLVESLFTKTTKILTQVSKDGSELTKVPSTASLLLL